MGSAKETYFSIQRLTEETMIFTKEVMNHPDVESYTEAHQEDDLLVVEELKKTGEWLLAMLSFALEKPSNAEWLRQFHEKNGKKWKMYVPENED